jgi:hypothetical protein
VPFRVFLGNQEEFDRLIELSLDPRREAASGGETSEDEVAGH